MLIKCLTPAVKINHVFIIVELLVVEHIMVELYSKSINVWLLQSYPETFIWWLVVCRTGCVSWRMGMLGIEWWPVLLVRTCPPKLALSCTLYECGCPDAPENDEMELTWTRSVRLGPGWNTYSLLTPLWSAESNAGEINNATIMSHMSTAISIRSQSVGEVWKKHCVESAV